MTYTFTLMGVVGFATALFVQHGISGGELLTPMMAFVGPIAFVGLTFATFLMQSLRQSQRDEQVTVATQLRTQSDRENFAKWVTDLFESNTRQGVVETGKQS